MSERPLWVVRALSRGRERDACLQAARRGVEQLQRAAPRRDDLLAYRQSHPGAGDVLMGTTPPESFTRTVKFLRGQTIAVIGDP